MLLSQTIPEFLLAKEIEEGCSTNTIRAYHYDLKMFLKIIGDNDLNKLQSLHIRKFLQHLHQKSYSKRSLARKIACLKSFFIFCDENDLIEKNPAKSIKSPKIKLEEALPKFLTRDDIDLIHRKLLDPSFGNKIWRSQVYLLFRLLYASMARVSEISNLNIKDVNIEKKVIKVRGKGNKERYIPIDEQTSEILKNHIELRLLETDSKNSPLFLNSWRKRLKSRSIQREVQILKQKLHFPEEKTLTPHIFRHTGATHLRQNGMDISELQDLLGHANPNTTKIYAKNDILHLAQSYQKYHPLSNK